MSSDLDFFSGGDIPAGDKLRLGTSTSVGTGDTTVFNVSSGGGILIGFYLVNASSSANLTALKTTVDGASERTHTLSTFNLFVSGTGPRFVGFFDLITKFNTSLTVKMAATASIDVQALYLVR